MSLVWANKANSLSSKAAHLMCIRFKQKLFSRAIEPPVPLGGAIGCGVPIGAWWPTGGSRPIFVSYSPVRSQYGQY